MVSSTSQYFLFTVIVMTNILDLRFFGHVYYVLWKNINKITVKIKICVESHKSTG